MNKEFTLHQFYYCTISPVANIFDKPGLLLFNSPIMSKEKTSIQQERTIDLSLPFMLVAPMLRDTIKENHLTLHEITINSKNAVATKLGKFRGKEYYLAVYESPIILTPTKEIFSTIDGIYLIESRKYGKYLVKTRSWGGAFSEDGDQDLYSSLAITKVNNKTPLEDLENAQPEAEMWISNTENWVAGANTDNLVGSSSTCKITGEDKFFKIFEDKLTEPKP
jgi:hypothetical protein